MLVANVLGMSNFELLIFFHCFFSTFGRCWMSFRCNRNSWALEFIVASVIVIAVVVEWSG